MLPPRPNFTFRRFTLPTGLGVIDYLILGIAFLAIAPTGASPQAGTGFASPSAPQSVTQSNPAPGPDTGQYVLKSRVPLVVLDVVATDKKGHPVHGLMASDFTALENGEEMTVQSFEEHRSDQAPPPAPLTAQHAPAPNVFTNAAYVPNSGPLNVLLLDALNTRVSDQMYVRDQVLEYLKKVPAGTSIAIFVLTNRLYLLQGFTTNAEAVKAILSGKKGSPTASSLANASPGRAQRDLQHLMAYPNQFQGPFNPQFRMQTTLGAVNDLAHYLSALPGRKNLIWFTGGFPSNPMPAGDGDRYGRGASPDAGSLCGFYQALLRQTDDLMNMSQVAVYPVDARGLINNPAYGADVTRSAETALMSNKGYLNANAEFFFANTAGHDLMRQMAVQTGGKAFYDENGLKGQVQEAITHGSNYYTLTYTPINRQWDSRFRSVRVKLDQSDVAVSYRHGYCADDPHAPPTLGKVEKVLHMSIMERAMLRGAPDPTQILFQVKIAPVAGTENSLPSSNKPNPNEMKPPYRHFTVQYVPDLTNIAFTTTPDGAYHGSYEFVTELYDPDGELMNWTSSEVNTDLPTAKFKELMQGGQKFDQDIGAPAKGVYFLRLGVHDINTDHVGAVEVPLTAIQPEPASPAAP